jgi:hypothetical protein
VKPQALALILVIGLAACSGRHADRQVQLCLESEQGVTIFREILVAISARHKLRFFDQSSEVERDLKALGSGLVGRFPIHHFHLHDKSAGVEISASNLGLGPYETTFSYDLRNDRQRTVADDLIASLEGEFEVLPTPDNRGALPLPKCPASETDLVARDTVLEP